MQEKIAVLGSGSWGTALAKLLADNGHDVIMWALEEEVAEGINARHRNPLYLPEVDLPRTVRATASIGEAVKSRGVVVSAVPSHALRGVWERAAGALSADAIAISCTKGIESPGFKRMTEVIAECARALPEGRILALSGPSFAKEVAAGRPTSVVIAGKDPAAARRAQSIFRSRRFLAFTASDVIGVEVGGAVKNVIAIAAGITDGMKLGFNARASLITRGLYEMIKIGKALGANPLTFAGLSGIGDLVLTCTEGFSRNHLLGRLIGEGARPEGALSEIGRSGMVAEGAETARAVRGLIESKGIKAPICEIVHRILFEGLSPPEAMEMLLSLDLGEEMGSITAGSYPLTGT